MKRLKPSKRKVAFVPSRELKYYLQQNNRTRNLPVSYTSMLRYSFAHGLQDAQGNDTLWKTVQYEQSDLIELSTDLIRIYALLKTDGDLDVIKHLSVARIDVCVFGNSMPFRAKIINDLNDNYDYYYIKHVDASRLYGLELEHFLSPNKITYFVDDDTLVEEHIAGIPGDQFLDHNLHVETEFNQIRFAKEFIKFNERCFVRLLGDMRSYNYVVDITPDIEGNQYRIRAIDFDQQSYEGTISFYQPKYFKENHPVIFVGMEHVSPIVMRQYQIEERSLIATRIRAQHSQFRELIQVMVRDDISTPRKINQLKSELNSHHRVDVFNVCKTMGDLVLANINLILSREL